LIAISKSVDYLKATVLVGDCEVHEVIPVENGNIEKLKNHKFKGGGGTDHVPFYKWVVENKPTTKVIVHLTDGYTTFPDKPEHTRFNTIWVSTSKEVKYPFGQVINIGSEDDE
jgi:predicted metal-dependent peptidase